MGEVVWGFVAFWACHHSPLGTRTLRGWILFFRAAAAGQTGLQVGAALRQNSGRVPCHVSGNPDNFQCCYLPWPWSRLITKTFSALWSEGQIGSLAFQLKTLQGTFPQHIEQTEISSFTHKELSPHSRTWEPQGQHLYAQNPNSKVLRTDSVGRNALTWNWSAWLFPLTPPHDSVIHFLEWLELNSGDGHPQVPPSALKRVGSPGSQLHKSGIPVGGGGLRGPGSLGADSYLL